MGDRKVILVAGLPSGGTSLVAGVLHHLGVDMGDIPTLEQERKSKERNYRGFECTRALRDFGGLPSNAPPDVLFDTAREYIDGRLAEANGPCGVKLNVLALLGLCENVESLPIQTVAVERDLETTFQSDIKYHGADYSRAADRGVLHLALRQLLERVWSVCSIEYEAAIRRPGEAVDMMIRSLELEPTNTQFVKAAMFIDPAGCKWEAA